MRGTSRTTLLAVLFSILSFPASGGAGPGKIVQVRESLIGKRGRSGIVKGGKRCQLHRVLSKLGEGSRTVSWKCVKEGRVSVNGLTVRDPLMWVDMANDVVKMEGRQCNASRSVVWMLHKPAGYQTAARDDRGRKTVYDLLQSKLPHGEWVFPVGRLDADTEGLLLFTNDGVLGNRLTDPSACVWKEYFAWVNGLPSNETLANLSSGVLLDGVQTRPADFFVVNSSYLEKRLPWMHKVESEGHARGVVCVCVRLREGRHRQVRRMLSGKNHMVVRLIRVGMGSLFLGNLESGDARQLSTQEVEALFSH